MLAPRRHLGLALGLGSILLAAAAAGCGGRSAYVWASELPLPEKSSEPVIQPRDTLLVQAGYQKDISGEFVVRDDGSYQQPPIGNVRAAGRTPTQLARELRTKLQGMVVNPEVTVSVPKRAPIRVHVIGEVKAPGSFELDRDHSVTAGLAAAGWLNEFAGSDKIYVVRPSESPSRIRFDSKDLKTAESRSASFELKDGDTIVIE